MAVAGRWDVHSKWSFGQAWCFWAMVGKWRVWFDLSPPPKSAAPSNRSIWPKD